MFYTVIRRLLATLLLVLGVIVMNFLLIHLAPGSPIDVLIGNSAPSPEYVSAMKNRLGLDKPTTEQLLVYIRNVAKGDLGNSLVNFEPVSDFILSRLLNTALLMISALAWSTIVGVFLGVLAAMKARSTTDTFVTLLSVTGYSLPYFWLGMMLILLFSVRLDIFPIGGAYTIGTYQSPWLHVMDRAWHLVLPSFALGLYYLAVVARMTRASMLEVLSLEYVSVARAKGLRESQVLVKHALRNALFPVVTIIGLNLGTALGGAVLTETVFSYPGLGRVMYDALLSRDYPVMLGVLLFVSIAVSIANLLTDLLYLFLDPRLSIR